MKTLFVNGCCLTAGSEIEYENQRTCHHKSWANLLAYRKGWQCVNIADWNRSNESITRTTIDWLAKNIDCDGKYNASNLVVMIQWSVLFKYEEWDHNHKKWVLPTMDEVVEDLEIQKHSEWQMQRQRRSLLEYRWFENVYTLARILESYGIEYYFINGGDVFSTVDKMLSTGLVKEYSTLVRAYGDRKNRHFGFSEKNEVMRIYLKKYAHPEWSKNHWAVDAQEITQDLLKRG